MIGIDLGRGRGFHRQDWRARAEGLTGLDVDLGDGAGGGGGHLDRRLGGLDLDEGLIDRDGVAGCDQDGDNVDAVDALAELGDGDGGGHREPPEVCRQDGCDVLLSTGVGGRDARRHNTGTVS